MIRRMLMLMTLVCLIFAGAAEARRPAAVRAPFDTRRILWIGAHPDDELLIAPLLGSLCIEATSRCLMVVVTRRENGPGELPGGCSDLGALREQEMRAAAAAFRADLTQWTFPDVMRGFDSAWPHDPMIAALREAIAIVRPTVILTFDFGNAAPGRAIALDARARWFYLVDEASRHATQFSNELVDSLRHAPDAERIVYLARPLECPRCL